MEVDPAIFFHDLSESSKDGKNGPNDCSHLLETLNRSLIEEQIQSSSIDLLLLHAFEKCNGLISFINRTIKIQDFKKSIIKSLEILYTLVNNFSSKFVGGNIRDMFSLCGALIKLDTRSDVKVKILDLLHLSLEKLDICCEENDVASTYTDIIVSLQNALKQNHTDTVKEKEMVVLGYLVKRYQYLIDNNRELQCLFVKILHSEMVKPKKSQHVICGFFTGFALFCKSFPLNLERNEDKKLIERLYQTIYNLVVPTERTKIGNRAALNFLANNISLFGECLLNDHKFWHMNLLKWLECGVEEKKVAASTLRALFREISNRICEKDGQVCSATVKYFNTWSMNILYKNYTSTYEKRLSIQCLKSFSKASFACLPENEAKQLFVQIMQRFETNYVLKYEPTSEEWEFLPDFVQTISSFVQFKTFTPNEFYRLQRVTVNMIKSFHHLPLLHHYLVVDGIILTSFYLKTTEYFDPFLENLVYQGVIWSCSHEHVLNSEFSSENKTVVTVRNFFPLWHGLLKVSSNRAYDKEGLYLDDRKYILERIVRQLVKTLMLLINKLNVRVKLKEDVVITDVEKAYQVEQSSDYAIFLNVVDLYKEIFDNIEPRMLKKCVCKMIKHILKKCLDFPLVSGFYKLLSYVLKTANALKLFTDHTRTDSNQDVSNTKDTLRQFLVVLLDRMTHYKDELLIGCLRLLLETPVELIQDVLHLCVTPFITVFTFGRSYFPLAELGLNTLHRWQERLDKNRFDEFVSKIVPCLDTYLRSKSLLGQTPSNIEARRKTSQTLKKRKVVLETEPELVRLQRKVLSFVGKQSVKVCHAFIYMNDLTAGAPIAVYGGNVNLKISLPFEDGNVETYLDVLVPRVVHLALYSSDRKTRIAACELFQAIVVIFLGRAKMMSREGLRELEDLLRAVWMPLLELGSDVDQLVEQIFAPLVFQLIHWYASPAQFRGSHTAIMINSLMEGVTHPTNSALRDFSGKCINEFVKWTMKQTSERALVSDPINIKILVRKMRFFSVHSDQMKKLGAALIFNNIYQEIREEELLINIFWIEILHIFVNSLSSIENDVVVTQIEIALSHLRRVLVEKAYIFRVADDKRRVPSDIEGGTLRDVARWLLKQTASKSQHCRRASMDLFVVIAPLAWSDPKPTLKSFVEDVSRDFFNDTYEATKTSLLEDIPHTEDCTVLFQWLQELCCTLDGYNFVIQNRLCNVNLMDNRTFTIVNYFLRKVQDLDIVEALNLIERKVWVFTMLDIEKFKVCKSACVLSILQVYSAVLSDEVLLLSATEMWNENFWKLVLNSVFRPKVLYSDEMMFQPKYLEILTILLNNLPSKLPGSRVSSLSNVLDGFIQKNLNPTVDLSTNVPLSQRNVITGLIFLNTTNMKHRLNIGKYTKGLISSLMQDFYRTEKNNVLFLNDLQDTAFEYCNSIFELALTDPDEFRDFTQHLHRTYLVQSTEFNKDVRFGVFILNEFEDIVTPLILQKFGRFLDSSVRSGSLEITVEMMIHLLKYAVKHKTNVYQREISREVLDNWTVFQTFFESEAENNEMGIEFMKTFMLVCDTKDVGRGIRNWLIGMLLQEENVDKRLEIFYLLVNIVDDAHLKAEDSLRDGFHRFFGETGTDSIFDKLFSSIPNVKSCEIFKQLVKLYVKENTTTTDTTELLKNFTNNADIPLQRSTLETVYHLANDPKTNFSERYKIIKNIIPGLFQTTQISCVEDFYVQHIQSIVTNVEQSENIECNILYFMLIELLFVRIPLKSSEACPISQAAKNPELLKFFLTHVLNAFKKHPSTSLDVLRLYKCHAYNALASIVTNGSKGSKLYEKLFARFEDGRDILWTGIVDTRTVYDFPMFFDSIPSRRKIIVNIRNELRSRAKVESLRYIKSQKLFSSSLSEDVTRFDFTNATVRSQGPDKADFEPVVSEQCEIQLDTVDLNNHECMGTICGLIQHFYDTSTNELPREGEEDEAKLPDWMQSIRNALLSNEVHRNVKIFLIKVIDNMVHIFGHYSRHFLEPLLQFVVNKCAGNSLNYFVTDVVCIAAKWSSRRAAPTENEARLASETLQFLISNINNERADVFKYNLDLIKLMVESWRDNVQVPHAKLLEILSCGSERRSEVGIHLASIFLVNELKPWQGNETGRFLDVLLKILKLSKKSSYKPCAETVGLVLKYLKGSFSERVDRSLRDVKDLNKYVYCLEGVAIHFPEIISPYHVSKLISSLNQIPDVEKILHLKIILRRVERSLDILEEISDFRIVNWNDLMESPKLEIQIITLRIIKSCISTFATYKTYPDIIRALGRNATHPNALYRSCVYDISLVVYNEHDIDGICKGILLSGLADDDADNKQKVVEFWNNRNFSRCVADRFTFLFSNLYKPSLEEHFLNYVNYFLISALSGSELYQVEIFEHPLEDCTFEDYCPQSDWRLERLQPSVVPLFADTFTENEARVYNNPDLFHVKNTQADRLFTPTQSLKEEQFSKYTSLESSLSISSVDVGNAIKNPNDLVLSQKYRLSKQKFLKDKAKISNRAAHQEVKKQVEKVEKRKDLVKEREKMVTVYRKYRKGDFPDIQISLASVLEPLKMLSLYDGEIAKLLLLEIVKGIMSKVEKNESFLRSMQDSIEYVFQNSTSFNPNLISALLDMLLKHKDKFHLDNPQLVSYVCQQSGLLSVGTLLLEEYLIFAREDGPSGSKRGLGTEPSKETTYWVKLVELYKEMEDWNMVRSIFLEKMDCKDAIQKAIQHESESQWHSARELYAELINTDVSFERKDFYYDSYFKCFANLGEWDKLPEEIESTVASGDVWDHLWDKDWCQQKLLPWYVQAQVKNVLFAQEWSEEFSTNLNKCLSSAEKAEYMQANFSEELCVLWLFKKDVAASAVYLNSYVRTFLNNWQLLNPMHQSLRYNKVLELRNVVDIDEFLVCYRNLYDDLEETLSRLFARWANTSKENLPSILLNETRTLYRTLFVNLLREKVVNFEFVDVNECLKTLEALQLNLDMSLIDVAIQARNHYVSRKYLRKYCNLDNLQTKLAFSNIAFLKAQTKMNPEDQLKLLSPTVDNFGTLFDSTNTCEVLLPARTTYFEVLRSISSILTKHPSLFLQYKDELSTKLKTNIDTLDDIDRYASKQLRSAIESYQTEKMDCGNNETSANIKHVSKAYVKLAYFTREYEDGSCQGDFILYVLRAMKLNSEEARQLFPCILILSRLESDFVQLFIDETSKIPTWMFLGWIPQLLANLDSRKLSAISNIVLRIATMYPQAVMYPYRLSKQHYSPKDDEIANDLKTVTDQLDNILLNDPMVDKFLKALSYVAIPSVVLRDFLSKMFKAQNENDRQAIYKSVMDTLFKEKPSSRNAENLQGRLFAKISKYKRRIENVLASNKVEEGLRSIVKSVDNDLKEDQNTSVHLKDYCPWLANFSGSKLGFDLEIPGQYTGEKLPLPQHHVKISGFQPDVSVMPSIRKPIKITIIGLDTKEYSFLVKFGEDIRQDHRIEQLFGLMNGILKSDATCALNDSQILTYQVIPLTSNLGMIQWINDTTPLKEFLLKTLNKVEIVEFDRKYQEYINWLHKGDTNAAIYGWSAKKYPRHKTISFYRSLVNDIPWDILRRSFLSISTTTENYIALRDNFIKSYAVMCSSHWLLGIGDRHLNNTLISTKNGRVLGIDFGHAFGTATEILPVPELVPFRLTPHIVNLMEPLRERGQFRHSMIHCLRALRTNHKSLLATMNVFVEEPSLDWLEQAGRFESGQHEWYPNVKIDQTKRKLHGENSVKIFVEDLRAGRKDPKFIEAYVGLVEGSPEFDLRAKFAASGLSVEEQVDCLLDHATDYNLLGRMFHGWMAWI